MELRELKTFRVVAQTLNFTRAAEILGYAQSSVTAQIRSLEADLGVPLFNRLNRRVSLTDAGVRLLDYAHRIIGLCVEAQEVVSAGLELSGKIIISAPESVCTYKLPALLHTFKQHYPTIRVVFQPMAVSEIYTALWNGVIDIALLLDTRQPPPHLQTSILASEQIFLLAAGEHPLAHAVELTPEMLQNENFLLTERGCAYRQTFVTRLHSIGLKLPKTLEFSSIEAIKQCAMAQLGLAYLPAMTVVKELADCKLIRLPWSELELSLQLVWHADKWMSPATHAFIKTCHTVYGE
jgi:DNA-binding transcriptional LysR family regulator